MKRPFSALSAALLLLALLAGCSEALPPEPAPTAAPPAAVPAAPENAAQAAETVFSRGRIEGRLYESDFLSLRFSAPEGWRFATDEELAQRMGLSLDIVGADVFGDAAELAKAIAAQAVVLDMAAAAPDNSANVLLTIEDLEATGSAALTETAYASLLQRQLQSITDLQYEPETPESGELAGTPCATLLVHLRDFGLDQRFYLLRRGKYMAQIALTGAAGALPDADEFFTSLQEEENHGNTIRR